MSNQTNQLLRVVICIITYNRLKELARLLRSLSRLEFIKSPPPCWQVVVVDNHADAPSKDLIEEVRKTFPVPIIYSIEPVKGIASARNKAVSLAPPCDFIAFIDDDEVADPHWLDELLYVQGITQADVVNGPVMAYFDQDTPKWVINAGFFNHPRRKTGTKLEYASTNNVLVKETWFSAIEGPFDTRLNLTGGSDNLFFTKIFQKNAKIVWADEAIVLEYYPPDRNKPSWLIQRAFRAGLVTTLIERLVNPSWRTRIARGIKSLGHLASGLIYFFPLSLLYGFGGTIEALRLMARGAGEFYALMGGVYEEYAAPEIVLD